jgi:hypothetical protein
MNWVAIIDDDPEISGKDSVNKYEEVKEFLFDGDDDSAKDKIHKIDGIFGIENMFTCDDLKLIDGKITCKDNKDKSKVVGEKRKVLFAKSFYEKVLSNEIIEENISNDAKDKFGKIFDFIDNKFTIL